MRKKGHQKPTLNGHSGTTSTLTDSPGADFLLLQRGERREAQVLGRGVPPGTPPGRRKGPRWIARVAPLNLCFADPHRSLVRVKKYDIIYVTLYTPYCVTQIIYFTATT